MDSKAGFQQMKQENKIKQHNLYLRLFSSLLKRSVKKKKKKRKERLEGSPKQ